MRKYMLAVFVLVVVLAGCEMIAAGARSASEKGVNVGTELQKSPDPYVKLGGYLLAAVATAGLGISRKMSKTQRDLTEKEKQALESVAVLLANAIEIAGADKVKKAVASTTKHDPAAAAVLESILAQINTVPQQ